MVRSSTRFHHHAAHLKTGYGGYILSTLNPSRVDHFTPLINSTQLKNIFCNINTQYFNIFHGPSPFFENRNSMLAYYDAVFKGWVHFIGLLL
ncbi:hypothetical protein CbuG_0586 [Coxiella burnetii CbuG_Q212]|nr:hypothetical protein CbuG_0586 [Coxiella burnetii CbuG_Q212]